jgi:hypothetical protein
MADPHEILASAPTSPTKEQRRRREEEEDEEEETSMDKPLFDATDIALVLNKAHETCCVGIPMQALRALRLEANACGGPGANDDDRDDNNRTIWIGRIDDLATKLGVVRFGNDLSQAQMQSTSTVARHSTLNAQKVETLESAFRNLGNAKQQQSAPNLNEIGKQAARSMPSPASPATNRERDEELGSRSLYSFYVVLKAIHDAVLFVKTEDGIDNSSNNNNNKSSMSSLSSNGNIENECSNSLNETNVADSALKYMVMIPGSGGVAGDTLRYVRRFVSMGYVVIVPDDMAWPAHLRNRPRKDLENTVEDSYWNDFALYDVAVDENTGQKQSASGSLVYKSSAKSFIENDSILKKQYDAALKCKSVVVSHILLTLPDFIKNSGIALVGNSEGAAVLGMLNDKTFMNNYATASAGTVVKARIAIAYPFEPSYFTDGLKGWFAGTFGSSWSSNCPVLCINGSEDEFFGPLASVASEVVSHKRRSVDLNRSNDDEPGENGQEKAYSGDASIALEKLAKMNREKNQGPSNLLSVIVVGAKHGILKTHDEMVSKLLLRFLRAPQKCLKNVVESFGEEVVDYKITANNSVGKLVLETKKDEVEEVSLSPA